MTQEIEITLLAQTLVLHASKVLFWKNKKTLIVSDMHLGKAAHFRKAGIPLPSTVQAAELDQLNHLIHHFNPDTLLFLGDLFHSTYNSEWDFFFAWLKNHKNLELILVRGNHDILPNNFYSQSDFKVIDIHYSYPFSFSHYRNKDEFYNFSGHLHPAVVVKFGARQSLRLPCFLFGTNHALMPAYGKLTGTSTVKKSKSDKVYAIAEEKLFII